MGAKEKLRTIRVALAGNPNVGKTSLLNHMAGSNLKVGNWAGVTVEKREGRVRYKNYDIELVDLPGIYTLEPVSEDEYIAYAYLTQEKPDVVINVVETANMERDLLLSIELLERRISMVIALNMVDEAQKLGIEVDDIKLSELLGVPVVRTNGRTGQGIKELLEKVVEVYEKDIKPKEITYSEPLYGYLLKLCKTGKETPAELLERLLKDEEAKSIRDALERELGKKAYNLINEERFALAHGLYSEVVRKRPLTSRDITEALDKLLLHPYLGFPVFIAIMFLTFKIAFDFSSPFMDWVDGFMNGLVALLVDNVLAWGGAGELLRRFLVEGFVPLWATLLLLITLLEFSGYLPRIAFLMDRFMHKLGLHGKSVIPLILGLGCNVPAIMATRTIENRRDKLLVMAMIPFMSCPARLVVFAFAVIFFKNPTLVILFLYLLGVGVALLTAFLLRRIAFRGLLSHFIMELPPYRLPTLKLTLRIVWAHLKAFLYRAGTLIFAANIGIWLLLNLPPGVENPKDSLAGKVGQAIVPIFKPIGIEDWKMTTSLIPAFLAREIVLGSMATIYAVEGRKEEEKTLDVSSALKEQAIALGYAFKDAVSSVVNPLPAAFEVEEHEGQSLKSFIANSISPATALSFMVFLLVYTSCLGTVGIMWKESGSRFALGFLAYSFIMGWLMAFVVYNLSKLWIT